MIGKDDDNWMCKFINFFNIISDAIKVMEDGDLETLGLMDYDKRLSHTFTAHPKIDPVTGKN